MSKALRDDLLALMRLPGLSGFEERVRSAIRQRLERLGRTPQSDALGNLWVSFPGQGPSVMLFAHMDQLGFIVRHIETDGFLRLERLGGVPERALAAQEVLIGGAGGNDLPGVIANKNHHATDPSEKYTVLPYRDIYVDAGFATCDEAEAAGVRIGAPVVYSPHAAALANGRVAGTSVDDRAGCAVLLGLARQLTARADGPPVHLCFTVQEEFNLRGAQPLAQRLQPAIALQIDLMLACDTPDMAGRGNMRLGGGPGMSLYSFHGRGTLNGVIPHPALVALAETAAAARDLPLQRSAQVGVLTDLSYVQLVGDGVAALDLGFPLRYSHSAREVCDLGDLLSLTDLLAEMLARITADFSLEREG
ncbi:MAG: M20/M25/M40 family metallo-hydrolase [Pseudomonadota bacterium]